MKIRRLVIGGMAALALSGTAVGYLVGRARAAIPTSQILTYSGALTNAAGDPLKDTKNIQFQLRDQATAGNIVCSMDPKSTNLGENAGGAFQIVLSNECTDKLRANPDLWVEILVDGNPMPRTKIGAVPYALEAEHATTANNASAAAGALKATIDGLNGPPTVLEVKDMRAGCPPLGKSNTDLFTLPFTLTKSTAVELSGESIRFLNGRADLGLFLDGVEIHRSITHTSSLDWQGGHAQWAGTLPAGAHTASLRGLVGADNIWGCLDSNGSSLYGRLRAIIHQ